MPNKCREMIQPGIMLFASMLNMAGSIVAVTIGAAEKNAFFYTSLTTSALYAGANAYKVYQVATHVEREEAREPRELA